MIRKTMVVMAAVFLLSPAMTFAADFCAADNNGDCKVDLTDLVTMKSEFLKPDCEACSPPYPAPVAQTGQVGSYGPGDDGAGKGVRWPQPRFTNNGNGTVTDNLTGLIWLSDANCATFAAPENWINALSDCNGLASGACGLSDGSTAGTWRLPNRLEMLSLVDSELIDPSLPLGYDSYFTRVVIARYWTSTTNAKYPNLAFGVHLAAAVMDQADKFSTFNYVWCVRGPQ
jgi:hypothetical protein